MQLNDVQSDLLKEAFNLGVGQAARALSEIAGGEEIQLSVPEVQLKTLQELEADVRSQSGDEICGVSESFRGVFSGRAMMLYSQEESLELVKIMLGEAIPVEEMSEMESEALGEVGNIVLNACISTLANLLEIEIETDVPNVHLGDCAEVIDDAFGQGQLHQVMYLRMTFNLAKHELYGHIGFFLNLESTQALTQHLDQYFQKMMQG